MVVVLSEDKEKLHEYAGPLPAQAPPVPPGGGVHRAGLKRAAGRHPAAARGMMRF
jgi:hypothetical protein